jgi:hypothetical protein
MTDLEKFLDKDVDLFGLQPNTLDKILIYLTRLTS